MNNTNLFLGWEVQDQNDGTFSVSRRPGSWFIDVHLLAMSSHGGKDKRAL